MTAPRPATPDPQSLLAHFEWVRGLARTLARDTATAEDLTQDAMLAAIERPPRDGVPVRRWFGAVLRNFMRQGIRGDLRRARREGRAARQERVPSTADLVARTMLQNEIVATVLRLDEPYRRTVLLRFFEGRTPREIADMEGIPVATVHTRLGRALVQLRVGLDKHYGERSAWVFLASALAFKPNLLTVSLLGASIVKAKIAMSVAVAVLTVVSLWWFQSTPSGVGHVDNGTSTSVLDGGKVVATAERAAPEMPGTRDEIPAVANASEFKSASMPVTKTNPQSAVPRILRGRVIDCDSRAIRGIGIRFRSDIDTSVRGLESAKQLDVNAQPRPDGEVLTLTSDEGRFEIPVPDSTKRLEVVSDQYLTVLDGYAGAVSAKLETILVVAPKIGLAGFVVNGEERPIAGAAIHLVVPEDFRARFHDVLDASIERIWGVESDDRGKFELIQVPQIPGAKLTAVAPGYLPATISIAAGSDFSVKLVLKHQERDVRTLAGVVLDVNRRPVVDAKIGTGGGGFATSDHHGRFILDLTPNATVKLHVAKKGLRPVTENVKPIGLGEDAAWPDSVEVFLREPALEITGRVVNAEGKPIPHSSVWIENATLLGFNDNEIYIVESVAGVGETAPVVNTNKVGAFKFQGLAQKNYTLSAMDPTTLAVVSANVNAGTVGAEIRVHSNDLFPRVSGVVVDQGGNPVDGVDVSILRSGFTINSGTGWRYSTGGGALGPVRTGIDGRFAFKNVAKARLVVSADSPMIMPNSAPLTGVGGNEEVEQVGPLTGDSKDSMLTESSDAESVVVKVSLRCHCKIELTDPAGADAFEVLDGRGEKISIYVFSGDSTRATDREKLTNGNSPMVAVDESARTLVLFRDKKEVRRMPLKLKPGEPNVIRP